MRKLVSSLLFMAAIGFLLSSCSRVGSGNKNEPSPPYPFPVDLYSVLKVSEVSPGAESATLLLMNNVQRNTEMYGAVTLDYEIHLYGNEHSEQLQEKRLLDQDIALYVKKIVNEEILLDRYGEYTIKTEAYYGSSGQQHQFVVSFGPDGISVERLP
ncbi:hypothetical protein M6D81_01715 [Paenibacillus sp. J5C_2022]|uniref:hypothetical protein n=1 Tax=Paenibacillus sp. J5C2022 TaxID=2977129 RepID=UPI0021D36A3A|nr:hypothetical protein [Paenibacillus sp. J5C2022]MCU6707413.1 hypothetical protein [Paenibacillus sp. J5C2022]